MQCDKIFIPKHGVLHIFSTSTLSLETAYHSRSWQILGTKEIHIEDYYPKAKCTERTGKLILEESHINSRNSEKNSIIYLGTFSQKRAM